LETKKTHESESTNSAFQHYKKKDQRCLKKKRPNFHVTKKNKIKNIKVQTFDEVGVVKP
jgi:hypothetical protein